VIFLVGRLTGSRLVVLESGLGLKSGRDVRPFLLDLDLHLEDLEVLSFYKST